jgi:hypothetical protein
LALAVNLYLYAAGSLKVIRWLADWALSEGIVSFAGQPFVGGKILGVLAIFRRSEIIQAECDWLRIFADHAAIANARAFEEIARLRRQLEMELGYLREEVREALPSERLLALVQRSGVS